MQRLLQRRTIWWPTRLGWAVLLVLVAAPLLLWGFAGEGFLARTQREPAEVLIVEGWIGIKGVRAAQAEFEQGGYGYIVTAGGLTNNRWGSQQWNYAAEAAELLVRSGVPASRVIEARAPESDNQRTFEAALAVRDALERRGLRPAAVNVFTLGAHARRSRLVYAKALPAGTKVGVIAWTPDGLTPGPWWKSSERAQDLLKETVGYAYELLLNSGRTSNSPARLPP